MLRAVDRSVSGLRTRKSAENPEQQALSSRNTYRCRTGPVFYNAAQRCSINGWKVRILLGWTQTSRSMTE
ncbi:hypothetical protein CBM2592_B180041 [Cupriavidus taiwanensis]|nr:hypothetical protein CBM2592_B180041 [Cupriavidus taiwanensis]SOY69827.1 hypothetical protein CBM2588_B200041 [Cupriavidus taiwanensis]SOY95285.1 hypothetical protein CBM2591_B170041 [Cupriavidus taiwanensis]SOZ71913.1 hypothetical protein CBM2617_B180250 [Cupriavidus taiwanensis]SOZ87215.1 hypothetical protein CBM2618_B200247 [Cupriavidus taiwanensis]